jgi:hypothetical protein
MDGRGCDVYYDLKENQVLILYNGETRAVVREDGHFSPNTNRRLDAYFWGFDPPEDMTLWTACILAEAAYLRAKHLEKGVFKVKNS